MQQPTLETNPFFSSNAFKNNKTKWNRIFQEILMLVNACGISDPDIRHEIFISFKAILEIWYCAFYQDAAIQYTINVCTCIN